MEDTVKALHSAMTGRTPEQIKAAEVLYILALSEYSKEPGFVAKLVGCFADGQTDEQLIAEVNAVFGTDLDPEDFSAIMNYANHQLVEVAKAQLGNVGGEPYWSWYGFPSRVECVRPTLDFVQVAEFVGVRSAKPRKLFDSHCDF